MLVPRDFAWCALLSALLLTACPARPQGTPTPNTGGGGSGASGQSASGGTSGSVSKGTQTTDAEGRRFEDLEFLSDGFAIRGRLVLPAAGADPVPAAVLVHMLGSSRAAYDPLQLLLAERGIGSLAIDLRGHGASENGPRGFEHFAEMEWQAAQSDVRHAVHALAELDEVDENRRAIVGASIGANFALLVGAEVGDTPVVALSPGRNYKGITPESAVASVADNLLVAATTGDTPAAQFLDWVVEQAPQVEVWQGEGNAHGTNMLEEAALEEQLIEFLNRRWEALAPAGEDDLGFLTPEEVTDDAGFPVDEAPAPAEGGSEAEGDWQDQLPPASEDS